MAARPLEKDGIEKLELLFGEAAGSIAKLRSLDTELAYRKVPRARALHQKVRTAMTKLPHAPAKGEAPFELTASGADDIFSGMLARPVPVNEANCFKKEVRASAAEGRSASKASIAPQAPQWPTLSVEEARKLLKATGSTAWGDIERVRWALVQQAHPSKLAEATAAARERLEDQARRANGAYLVLARQRVAGAGA